MEFDMQSPLLHQFSHQSDNGTSITMQQTMYSHHNVSGKGIMLPGHSASKHVARLRLQPCTVLGN